MKGSEIVIVPELARKVGDELDRLLSAIVRVGVVGDPVLARFEVAVADVTELFHLARRDFDESKRKGMLTLF